MRKILVLAVMGFVIGALGADSAELQRKLGSLRRADIQTAADQITAGSGDSSLFPILEKVMRDLWRDPDVDLAESVAQHVAEAFRALAKRYPAAGSDALLSSLDIEFKGSEPLRLAFVENAFIDDAIYRVYINPNAEPRLVENLLITVEHAQDDGIPVAVAFLHKALNHPGDRMERNMLLQKSGQLIASLIHDGVPATELRALLPRLKEILEDAEWIPQSGDQTYSHSTSPLYPIANAASLIAGKSDSELTKQVQRIYAILRTCRMKSYQDSNWLAVLARLTGRKMTEYNPQSEASNRADDILRKYESGNTPSITVARYIEMQAISLGRALKQVDPEDVGPFLLRIASLTEAHGNEFRQAFVRWAEETGETAILKGLTDCAHLLGNTDAPE